MRNPFLFSTVFLILIIHSCIREVDIDIPLHESIIGVNCILAAGETMEVEVFKSVSISDTNSFIPIQDAQVYIFREDETIHIFHLATDSNKYVCDDFANANSKYRLEVEIQGNTLKAETNIPSQPEIARAEMDHGKYSDQYGEKLTHWMIEIVDDPTQENYYTMFFMDPPSLVSLYQFQNISDPVLLTESMLEYEPPFFLFSDSKVQNGKISIDLLGFYGTENGIPVSLQLVVRSIPKDYFDFLKSWIVHSYNQNNGQHVDVIDDLDPYRIFFQSQPVDLYSNIIQGIGIFGAYSQAVKYFTYVE